MTRLLAEMTWPDVERAVAAGATTVLLPLGATEQHGLHLPLGTDTVRAAALAQRLAAAIPGILVAPALPVGCSDEHSGFAGLLGLDHATLARVIFDCGWRMAGWGVRRLLLLSAHGGNDQALELAYRRLQERVPVLGVAILPSSPALADAVTAVAARDGISAAALGLHAGDGETSEMLHLRPDLVHRQRAAAGPSAPLATMMPHLRQQGVRGVSPNGTLGDPRQASAVRGEAYLAAQVASLQLQLAALADQEEQAVPTAAGGQR